MDDQEAQFSLLEVTFTYGKIRVVHKRTWNKNRTHWERKRKGKKSRNQNQREKCMLRTQYNLLLCKKDSAPQQKSVEEDPTLAPVNVL